MRRLVFLCAIVGAAGCSSKGSNTSQDASCAMGSEGCGCYGNDTCNGGLKCLSHLCVSLGVGGDTGAGGTTAGAGGTFGSGGTTGGTGGNGNTGSGGSGAGGSGTGGSGAGGSGTGGSGAGGSGTGGGAGNVLVFTGGVVTAGSNTFGITGGVYTFDDGVGSTIAPDCQAGTCFGSLNGTGPICVSGTGTMVFDDASLNPAYATYWGAAVALDLNNPDYVANGQLPYVASDYGVTGFQFSFQNNATSTVRMTYKVRDPGTGTLVDYCLDLATSTSVVRFSDARQSCYLAVPGPALTPALADHVEGIQWQVPTNPFGSVAFNYCVSGITPLTQ
jgi:hypothetical protein